MRVRIPPAAWVFVCFLILRVVQVQASVIGRSLVQKVLPSVWVCHLVYSDAAVTLCTYTDQIEADTLRKKGRYYLNCETGVRGVNVSG